tara:strand:- start:412 stop:1095 length:684 start_codon:yes stop_codon:yes gene_type:complete
MNIAIIPARGGSKRIAKKNIKEFCGYEMISYSISTAIESGIFEKIIVSTDSNEIADVSIKFGAEVPFLRPVNLSDDHTPINPVISHAIKELEGTIKKYENVCCIYPCAPLLSKEDLKESLELMISLKSDSCIPVCEFVSAPQRGFKVSTEKKLSWVNPDHRLTRSQDLEKMYHDVGAFAWAKKEKWLGGDISDGIAFVMENSRVVDIDNDEDWIRAEMLYKMINKLP